MASGRRLVLALLGLCLGTAQLSAQNTGTVTGRVVNRETRAPLIAVTVTIGGLGALTDEAGRYIILRVPAGAHTVQAQSLGFSTATQSVTVAAGATASVDFALETEAIKLDQIVATGYGQRRATEVTGSVKSVGTEEFATGRIVSAEKLLQGRVAGVQIIDSGEPGGGNVIRIRGGTSINASNDPLFVVDGVPLPVGGGLSTGSRNPLNFLNPEDIESMTILKDAAATAIYGSRGANGVILVETKSGRRATAQLSYSGTVSGSQVLKRADMLEAADFRATVQQYAPTLVPKLGSASTNWLKEVERDAGGQEHNIAFAGASEAMDYRFSLGYLNQDGVIKGTGTERLSASLNYGHRLLDERLNLRASLKGTRTDDLYGPGLIGGATAMAPTQPVMVGSDYFEWDDPLGPNNPLGELALTQDDAVAYRAIANLEARYDIPFLQGLNARVRAAYDLAQGERTQFYPSALHWQQENGTTGRFNRQNPRQTNGVFDAYLNLQRPLNFLNGNVDLTAGYSFEQSDGDYPSFYAQDLASDLLGPNGIPSAEDQGTFLNIQESKLASFFGRVNFNALDRYLLTLIVRRDGSSRFGEGNQWGTFPSAAVAWRLSEESFLKGRIASLTDLKLRLSWGVNGNQPSSNYQQYSTYTIGDAEAQALFGDEWVATIRPSAVDPNIKWEETTSTNVGLDYAFLDGRISGTIDYYDKKTEDLLFRIPVAAGTNLSDYVTTNIGSMKNRGLELSISADLLRAAGQRGLNWNVTFNAANNKNELTRVTAFGSEIQQRIPVGGFLGGVGNTIQILQPGHPVYSFFVFKHKRNADGSPVWADTNGSGAIDENDIYEDLTGDGKVNHDDRRPFESPAADWIMGASSTLQYGGFDMSFSLRANLGNHVYNNVASNWGHYEALRWSTVPNNLHASVLKNKFTAPQYYSDVYIEDASYLRMDDLTIGYTFRNLPAMQRVRVFGTLQNAFTMTDYTGVDPMSGINGLDSNLYPRSRTFTAGVSVGF